MRILIVSREYPPNIEGGISRRLERIVPRLLDRGVDLGVVSFGGSPIAGEKMYPLDAKSRILYTKAGDPSASDLASIVNDVKRLDRFGSDIAKSKKYEIVQIEEPVFGPFIRSDLPTIVTVHTTQIGIAGAQLTVLKEPRQAKRLAFSATFGAAFDILCLRKCAKVIAVSSALRDQLVHYYGLSLAKIEVIPNGIDLLPTDDERHRGNAIIRRSQSSGKMILTYAGRLVDFKRVDVLLRALRILKEKGYDDFFAYVAGSGPSMPSLIRLSQDLSLNENVKFTGYLESAALGNLLNITDVFVNPSIYEGGMSLAVMEAAAHGCAPVVSRIPVFSSSLVDGKDAIFFKPSDAQDLAARLIELMTDRSLLVTIQKAAANLSKNYGWDSSVEKLISLYYNLIHKI